mmetsp:Transcript_12695/g.12533  ORF Transcript_12695/g.12533 Transcript_12695/m.12533 type:complete len:112 (-) Transcript_12695:1218-1553(-)
MLIDHWIRCVGFQTLVDFISTHSDPRHLVLRSKMVRYSVPSTHPRQLREVHFVLAFALFNCGLLLHLFVSLLIHLVPDGTLLGELGLSRVMGYLVVLSVLGLFSRSTLLQI